MSTQDSGVFDVAVGLDQATLNATVAAFYGTFGSLFSQTLQVNQDNITTVSVDFQTAPTVSLAPPSKYVEEARAFAARHIREEQIEDAIRELTAGSMTATCSQFAVTINFASASPVTLNGSVTCGGAINVQQNSQGQNVLVISLSGATITIESSEDPTGSFSQLLNNLVTPLLLSYLNNAVLDPIQLPVLSLEGVNFTTPVVTDETTAGGNQVLVAYTGMNPVALPDPGYEWPAGAIFIGVDANALNAVANAALPQPSDQGGIDDPLNLSWGYSVQLGADLALQPGSGNSLSGTLSVSANADFTWHTPNGLPNIDFGATISGTVDVTASIQATPSGSNQLIQVTIQSISNPDLSVDYSGIIVLLEPFLGAISSVIVDSIVSTVGAALQGFTFTAYTLQPISMSFPFAGISGQLVLQNIALNTIAGPDGVPLATVTATASFATTTQTAVVKSTTVKSRRRPLLEAVAGAA